MMKCGAPSLGRLLRGWGGVDTSFGGVKKVEKVNSGFFSIHTYSLISFRIPGIGKCWVKCEMLYQKMYK